MAQVAKPLKDFIGIEHFSFRRIYSDQSRFYLCSVPEWGAHALQKGYLLRGKFEKISAVDGLTYVLWDHWPENDVLFYQLMKDSRENFNQDHGLSILKSRENCVDVYTFTTKTNNKKINNLYLNNIVSLEKFIEYFMWKFSPIIKKAEEQKIFLPAINKEKLILDNQDEREAHLNVGPIYPPIQKLNSSLCREGEKNIFYPPEKASLLFNLSPRQQECLFYLIRGQTAKQIAKQLGCSHRTVEAHIDHIKNKFKCTTKGDLINMAFEDGSVDVLSKYEGNYV